MNQNKIIKCLRHELNLSEITISDAHLLEATEGTFLLARIKLGIELSDFWGELKSIIGIKS